jgi:hypothetical protein
MSAYQFYEFQAIDRPLTTAEMSELRSVSTRGRITPTSFVNEYSWGDFRGNPDLWMERCFDAFLHLANWGTHVLKLRLPPRLLSPTTALAYLGSESASVNVKSGQVILSFRSDDEYGGEWVEGEGQLSSLIPVRAELARGDRRLKPESGQRNRSSARARLPLRGKGISMASSAAKPGCGARSKPSSARARQQAMRRPCGSWSTCETSVAGAAAGISRSGLPLCGRRMVAARRSSAGSTMRDCDRRRLLWSAPRPRVGGRGRWRSPSPAGSTAGCRAPGRRKSDPQGRASHAPGFLLQLLAHRRARAKKSTAVAVLLTSFVRDPSRTRRP